MAPCADLPKADAKLQLQCEVEYAKLRKVTDALSSQTSCMHFAALCRLCHKRSVTSSTLAVQLLGGLSKAKDTINPTSAHIMNAAATLGCGRKMVQIIVERIAQVVHLFLRRQQNRSHDAQDLHACQIFVAGPASVAPLRFLADSVSTP